MQTRIILYTCGKPRSSRNKLIRLSHKLGLCNWSSNFRLRLRPHHVKVFDFVSSCKHRKLIELGPQLCTYLSVSFGFAITVQHYNTRLHCSFCVMSCCHFFLFWCFVSKLLYLIFAGWLYQIVLLISFNT